MFRNILVALDGSSTATRALEEAIAIARRDGARLVLMTVTVPPRWRFVSPYVVAYPTEDDLERDAQGIVDEAEALVPDEVPVCTLVRRGPVIANAILDRVTAGGHDLVVVGSHGRGPLLGFLLGSVSRAVESRSPVPVLVVRAGATEAKAPQVVAPA